VILLKYFPCTRHSIIIKVLYGSEDVCIASLKTMVSESRMRLTLN